MNEELSIALSILGAIVGSVVFTLVLFALMCLALKFSYWIRRASVSTLDISNHDYSTFDPTCFKNAGVERVIIGCWIKAQTKDMALKCRAAGIVAEDLYSFVYYRLPWERREVENALSIAAEIGGIKRIWIDCEATWTAHTGDLDTEAAGTTPVQRINITHWVVAQVRAAGIEPCIYTSSWWWPDKMGNSAAFSGLKLWHSEYGLNNPDFPRPPITHVLYGGWTDLAAHQYSSTIPVCGRGRDHNYWFIEEEEMGMTPMELARLERLEAIVAANGIDTDGDNVADTFGNDALELAFARGWSAFLGIAIARQDLANHEADHPGGGPHTHTTGGAIPS